ncbi:MAG: prolyl oligopeptidase family serine peptidase [Planctomycetes bacterium]|nr:prolyl oligopeptidase family serine peptidase [Planctomycetota bacterium]
MRIRKRNLMSPLLLAWIVVVIGTSVVASQDDPKANGSAVKMPVISKVACPVTELTVSKTSYAAVRKPPGKGPFPAVIFLHGGLGQSNMSRLRENALRQATHTRFLAWGYVIVSATRRSIQHDPLDRGVVTDTLALVEAVRALPEVDPDSIVLYGGSGGGTLALDVVSASDKVAAIAAGEPATIIYMGMFNKSHVIRDANGKIIGDRRWDVMNANPKELYTDKLKQYTRKKMQRISCPVLILHGDRHALKKFNFEVFVPELRALGKKVVLIKYPGENHGFYWGRSKNPAMPLKANRDADAFFRKSIKAQPHPIDETHVKMVPVS